jgi:hypothetical protein
LKGGFVMYKFILLMILAVMSNNTAIAGNLEDGIGAYKENNYSQALELIYPIAEDGNVTAQGLLGRMYLRGEGVTQDYQEAAKWHRLAAEQGDAYSQYNLASSYYYGMGVSQNYQEAAKWYRLAAE